MRILFQLILLSASVSGAFHLQGYDAPVPPYAPAAGNEGTSAIHMDDTRIINWARYVHSISYGEDVSEEWRNPDAALGPPDVSGMDVTVLGRGGELVLWFPDPIVDGEGADFAVFENSFSDTFLELAFVEVSTDGEHFVRFPNYSLTADPVPGFGDIDPTFVHGYGGKYKTGYGTPFDLGELATVHDAISSGYDRFSSAFANTFVENFSYIDLNNIHYVRLIDIPGDGSQNDCEGFAIYDPYKTVITAGFDMDALGVLNEGEDTGISFAEWSSLFNVDAVPANDTDKDGWAEYLEYFFGTDPRNSEDLPEVLTEVMGDGSLKISYWWRKPVDAIPEIQTSTDGEQWQYYDHVPDPEGETKVIDGGIFVLETLTIPVNTDALYLRFRYDGIRVN